MKQLFIILYFFSICYLSACTENENVKYYGGTAEIALPAGEKLLNVTWKDADLWYLTRPMGPTDSAVTYKFKEKSTYGEWEGTFIIHETK